MTATPNYPVVLLVEQPLSALDARQVRSLHEAMPELPAYTVLVPVEDAAGRVEAAMGALGSGELMAPMALDSQDYANLQADLLSTARGAVATSVQALQDAGGHASGEVITGDPIEELVERVRTLDAQEAIVLTRPHVVSEFFHVDWTSRARRKLGVPVLHLLEHETFDEQAGQGEGISGF